MKGKLLSGSCWLLPGSMKVKLLSGSCFLLPGSMKRKLLYMDPAGHFRSCRVLSGSLKGEANVRILLATSRMHEMETTIRILTATSGIHEREASIRILSATS